MIKSEGILTTPFRPLYLIVTIEVLSKVLEVRRLGLVVPIILIHCHLGVGSLATILGQLGSVNDRWLLHLLDLQVFGPIRLGRCIHLICRLKLLLATLQSSLSQILTTLQPYALSQLLVLLLQRATLRLKVKLLGHRQLPVTLVVDDHNADVIVL